MHTLLFMGFWKKCCSQKDDRDTTLGRHQGNSSTHQKNKIARLLYARKIGFI
jgi:hypothetical protein